MGVPQFVSMKDGAFFKKERERSITHLRYAVASSIIGVLCHGCGAAGPPVWLGGYPGLCPHSLVDELGLSSLVVYRFFRGSLKPHWGLVYRGILDPAGRLPRVCPHS